MPITTGPAQSTLEAMLKADIGAEAKAMNASARPQPEAVQAPNGRSMQDARLLYTGSTSLTSSQSAARSVPSPSASAHPAAQATANSILQSVQQMMGRDMAMNPYTAAASHTEPQVVVSATPEGQEMEQPVKSKWLPPKLSIPPSSASSPNAPRVSSPLLHVRQAIPPSATSDATVFDWSPVGITERLGVRGNVLTDFSAEDLMEPSMRQELDQMLNRGGEATSSEVDAVTERAKQSRVRIQQKMHGGHKDNLYRMTLEKEAWKVEMAHRRAEAEAGLSGASLLGKRGYSDAMERSPSPGPSQGMSSMTATLLDGSSFGGPEQSGSAQHVSVDQSSFEELKAWDDMAIQIAQEALMLYDSELVQPNTLQDAPIDNPSYEAPEAKRPRTDDLRLTEADYASVFGRDTSKW